MPYSAIVRLMGAVVIGGVMTSILCALAERLSEMKLRGVLGSVLRDHFVVVGHGPMTEQLIRTLFAPPAGEDLVHWTSQERIVATEQAPDFRMSRSQFPFPRASDTMGPNWSGWYDCGRFLLKASSTISMSLSVMAPSEWHITRL